MWRRDCHEEGIRRCRRSRRSERGADRSEWRTSTYVLARRQGGGERARPVPSDSIAATRLRADSAPRGFREAGRMDKSGDPASPPPVGILSIVVAGVRHGRVVDPRVGGGTEQPVDRDGLDRRRSAFRQEAPRGRSWEPLLEVRLDGGSDRGKVAARTPRVIWHRTVPRPVAWTRCATI